MVRQPKAVPRHRPAFGRWLRTGIAVSLAVTIGAALVITTFAPGPVPKPAVLAGEVTTSFMPLVYSGVPYTSAQIVRIEVPRDALRNFGLAPAELPVDQASAGRPPTIVADVLVGEDGLARAVRFVRPERKEK